MFDDSEQVVRVAVVLAASLFAAATDISRLKIYNLLTLPLIATGLIYNSVVDGTAGIGSSLAGLFVAGGILLLPYLLGGMGAGDVKLMAGVGAWLGMPLALYVLAASLMVAGVYAAIVVIRNAGGVRPVLLSLQLLFYRVQTLGVYLRAGDDNVSAVMKTSGRRQRLIPFGAMVAIGALAVFVWQSMIE